MLLRVRLQQQCGTVSAGLGRCLQTALLSLQEAHSALAHANAHIAQLKQQQSQHTLATGAASAAPAAPAGALLQLPQPCPGVYEQRSGQGRFFSASVTAGGFWQCQEKSMFLAALRRELRGVARGLTPQLDGGFGWSMPAAGWLWAELDERKQPSGYMLWTGPDPDTLPDDCTECDAGGFWDRGVVLRFPPAWSCAPPQRIPAAHMRKEQLVRADLTATPAEAQLLLQAVSGSVHAPPSAAPAPTSISAPPAAPRGSAAPSAASRSAPLRSSAALPSSALPVAASALTRSASVASSASNDTLPYGAAAAAPSLRASAAPRRGLSDRSGSWGEGRFSVAGSSGLDALAEMASLAGPV